MTLEVPATLSAGQGDRASVAAMLARAFAEDPATCFIFPDPVARAKRLPRLFGLLFDGDESTGMRLVTAGGAAATLWRGPGRSRTSRLEMIRSAWPMLRAMGLGSALGRALAVSEAIDAHHPEGEFWYLHIAGCDPAMQGRGIGRAAVQAGLDRVAGSRLPVYLETPLEKNIGFYRGLGFDLTAEWQVPKNGPRFWSMTRSGS
ncbi:GNAT family N-acetyltransferase [Sphingomonas sp. ERG5]|uniref:GNAT family N-acetyltransferase n=1 Tax=Sphingomonas sp. ERG5 TaxID=1381597 RepID=UPI00054B1BD0|nr:GNAT family N-acetyltransferase [Sphingomonas sp. ERG5]